MEQGRIRSRLSMLFFPQVCLLAAVGGVLAVRYPGPGLLLLGLVWLLDMPRSKTPARTLVLALSFAGAAVPEPGCPRPGLLPADTNPPRQQGSILKKRFASDGTRKRTSRVGEGRFWPPPPPSSNRTGGFPASGLPKDFQPGLCLLFFKYCTILFAICLR